VTAHTHAFEFMGGCHEIVVCDKPEIGRHPPAPLRARRERHLPRDGDPLWRRDHPDSDLQTPDKAKVEQGVLLAERWIIARLRHRHFTSLGEANAAISRVRGPHQLSPVQEVGRLTQDLVRAVGPSSVKAPVERHIP